MTRINHERRNRKDAMKGWRKSDFTYARPRRRAQNGCHWIRVGPKKEWAVEGPGVAAGATVTVWNRSKGRYQEVKIHNVYCKVSEDVAVGFPER